jgi:hypothetical protein
LKWCKCKNATAHALQSDYGRKQSDNGFICCQRQVDSYEKNYRLILATQLMGESQVGGSLIGLMLLDLTREAFQNSWGPMEETIGRELVKIGGRVMDSKLKKETMGKGAILMENGKAQYIQCRFPTTWAVRKQPKPMIHCRDRA